MVIIEVSHSCRRRVFDRLPLMMVPSLVISLSVQLWEEAQSKAHAAPSPALCHCRPTERELLQKLSTGNRAYSLTNASALNAVGKFYLEQNRSADSRRYLLRALSIEQKLARDNDVVRARTLSLLAVGFHLEGNTRQYEKYAGQSKELLEKALHHANTLEQLDEIAGLQSLNRQFNEAACTYKRCLELARKRCNWHSPEMAARLETIGMLLHQAHASSTAIGYFRMAAAIREKINSDDASNNLQKTWDMQMIADCATH